MPLAPAPPVQYLATTRLGEKGQLTVPKEYRDQLSLSAGSPVAVLRIGDGLILMPEQTRFRRLCESIAFALQSRGVSSDELQGTLPEARRRVFRRRYPRLASRPPAGKAKRRTKPR